ncbi:MAG: LPS export ABC transporter permease LptF [Deltaproteobacteria bacterium]|nr:LPS export ABC transporter permease LptF [Deltaproteobacteria bacterium]
MPGILSRYIIKEISVPFFLSLAILTATALLSKAVKLIELMVTQGVGGSFIFWFIASIVPSFLIYTLPISFLIGVLVAFTRLSSDSEVTAMKASGLGLTAMLRPVMICAFFVYAATLVVTLYLFPWGNLNLKTLFFDASRERFISGLEEKTFYDRFKGIVLYVDKINARTGEMEGLFISERGSTKESNVFFASKGVFSPATERQTVYLKLNDGSIHRQTRDGKAYHLVGFASYTLELGLAGQAVSPAQKHNRELYTGELMDRAGDAEARGADPAPYLIDLHKRFALPASVFVFALLGLPLGIQKIRAAKLSGFSTALGVVLVYYVMSTAFEAIGEAGSLNPIAAVWASDVIFLIAGIFVFLRADKDRPLSPLTFRSRARKGGA